MQGERLHSLCASTSYGTVQLIAGLAQEFARLTSHANRRPDAIERVASDERAVRTDLGTEISLADLAGCASAPGVRLLPIEFETIWRPTATMGSTGRLEDSPNVEYRRDCFSFLSRSGKFAAARKAPVVACVHHRGCAEAIHRRTPKRSAHSS